MLRKLSDNGIEYKPLKSLHSYISCRERSVYCNDRYSSFHVIFEDAPQGSVLGPIVLLIYINDIVNASIDINFVIYADATTFLLKNESLISLHANVISELAKVNQWINSNKRKHNISKTNYTLFQNRILKNSIPRYF